jgi:hypothetical protein
MLLAKLIVLESGCLWTNSDQYGSICSTIRKRIEQEIGRVVMLKMIYSAVFVAFVGVIVIIVYNAIVSQYISGG